VKLSEEWHSFTIIGYNIYVFSYVSTSVVSSVAHS